MDYITDGLSQLDADQELVNFVMASLGPSSCLQAARVLDEWFKVNAGMRNANGRNAATKTWDWLTANADLEAKDPQRYQDFLADCLAVSSAGSIPRNSSWTAQARHSITELSAFMQLKGC